MRAEDIESAVGSLDERMIAEALDAAGLFGADSANARTGGLRDEVAVASGRNRGAARRLRIPLALAAAASVLIALLVSLAVMAPVAPHGSPGAGAGKSQGSPAQSAETNDPVLTIPARDIAFAGEGANGESQPLYFVYQGECYVRKYECGTIAPENVGEKLGKVHEGDAGDPAELSGNVIGELHEVVGYDRAFLVCLVSGSGSSEQRHVYVRDNDLGFATSAELFEGLLHLNANMRVRAVAHVDWRCGMDVSERSGDVHASAVGAFLDSLNVGALKGEDAILQENGWSCLADALLQRHLVFEADGGPSIPIHLYAPMSSFYDDDGAYYVCCDLLPQAYVAISKTDAVELVEALDALEHEADQEDATAAYRVFLESEEGYYRIIALRGASQPVLLVSKHRFDATGTVTGCTVYDYEAGYVREVGEVQCTSSAYSICAYDGQLYYGSHHYSAFVNPQGGRLSGEVYTEVFGEAGRTSYWRASIVDGEEGERERIGRGEGEARMQVEDLLGALPVEFAAIP